MTVYRGWVIVMVFYASYSWLIQTDHSCINGCHGWWWYMCTGPMRLRVILWNIVLARNMSWGCASNIFPSAKWPFHLKYPWKFQCMSILIILQYFTILLAHAKHGCTGYWLILYFEIKTFSFKKMCPKFSMQIGTHIVWLTHWRLGDVVILKSVIFKLILDWYHQFGKSLPCECYRASLMSNQYWSR